MCSSSSSSVVVVVVSLLVLSLLSNGAQGIRFKKGLFSSLAQENEIIHEEIKSSLIKTSDGSVAEVVLCKEAGNHNTGVNRKLISTTTTTTTSTSTTNSKNGEKNTGENKAKANNPTSKSKSSDGKTFGEQTEESHNSSQDLYVDNTDIAEMDYSPARRKPPIHN